MDDIFLQVLNMSLTASIVIVIVLIARLALKKAPKVYSYILWSVVWFRLLCPFSFESLFSLLPINTHSIPTDIMYAKIPHINTGISFVDNMTNPILATQSAIPYASVNPMQIWIFIGSNLWIIGMVMLLIYSIVSLIPLRSKLIGAVKLQDNIYLVDHITSPFVMGIICPKIYLPSTLTQEEQKYIILHEQTHIKRFDHIIKIIGFIALVIHWFNPLVWIAFAIFVKDMEMSCDESVMKQIGKDIRGEYSTLLLSLATGRKIIVGTPLAFGEVDTKGRIKNVINYKKPTFWVAIVSLIAVVVICVGLMVDPIEGTVIDVDISDVDISDVELSDIHEMNIGSEMPSLLYADEKIALMQGTFGLLIYNLGTREVANRISYKELKELHINFLQAAVSQNGKYIYMANESMSEPTTYLYSYNIGEGKLEKISKQPENLFRPIYLGASDEINNYYRQFMDDGYLVNETVVEFDNYFIYLRAEHDWSMKSLQLVKYQYDSKVRDVYDIFN